MVPQALKRSILNDSYVFAKFFRRLSISNCSWEIAACKLAKAQAPTR